MLNYTDIEQQQKCFLYSAKTEHQGNLYNWAIYEIGGNSAVAVIIGTTTPKEREVYITDPLPEGDYMLAPGKVLASSNGKRLLH